MGCLKLSYCSDVALPKVMYGKSVLSEKSLQIWLSVDPMSDKYPSMSPYNYCMNNPVILVDPDGMDIINGYRPDVELAKLIVKQAQSKLDAFGGNKKADGYKDAKKTLKAAKNQLAIALDDYNKVNNIIKALHKYNLDLYNSLNDLHDENGNEVDVYVRLKSLSAIGREGQTIENYNSIGGRFYYVEGMISCINCIMIEIDPGSTISLDPSSFIYLGQIFSHEGGHALYDVQNRKEYYNWLEKMGLTNPDYGGHHPDDPSGKMADSQEDKYKKNSGNSQ